LEEENKIKKQGFGTLFLIRGRQTHSLGLINANKFISLPLFFNFKRTKMLGETNPL
jgi:hypothetical protein